MAESNRQRRFFPDAFKLEVVAAIRGGRSVSAVSAELGLPDRPVRAWLRWEEGPRGGKEEGDQRVDGDGILERALAYRPLAALGLRELLDGADLRRGFQAELLRGLLER